MLCYKRQERSPNFPACLPLDLEGVLPFFVSQIAHRDFPFVLMALAVL